MIVTNKPYKKEWFAINNYLSDFCLRMGKKNHFTVSIYIKKIQNGNRFCNQNSKGLCLKAEGLQ